VSGPESGLVIPARTLFDRTESSRGANSWHVGDGTLGALTHRVVDGQFDQLDGFGGVATAPVAYPGVIAVSASEEPESFRYRTGGRAQREDWTQVVYLMVHWPSSPCGPSSPSGLTRPPHPHVDPVVTA
jgi:hypothetical protein